jgi:hypothetical protein
MNKLVLLLLSAILLTSHLRQQNRGEQPMSPTDDMAQHETQTHHPYAGMWVTEDGHIRHELLANGRYVEARGNTEKMYQGRYEVMGNHIDYWDDTGFTADGEFVNDVLYHAGMVLYRQTGAE